MKKYRINFLYCLIITLTVWAAYAGLVKSFFQQDEWFSFGQLISMQAGGLVGYFKHYFQISLLHLTPLSSVFFYLPFKFFGLNPAPYAVVSISLHTLNSLLVFWLIYRLTRDNFFALVSSLLFAGNRLSHQAITWFAAYTGSLGAALFMLCSLIAYVNFLGNGKRSAYYFSLVCLIIGLLFKETIVFLFLLLPLLMRILTAEKYRSIIKQNLSLLLTAAVYLSYRFVVIALASFNWGAQKGAMVTTQLSLVSEFSRLGFIFEFLRRLFTVPLKILAQSFFSQGFIIRSAEELLGWLYPPIIHLKHTTAYDITTQTFGCDVISYIIAGILIIVFRLLKKYFMRRNLFLQSKLLEFSFLLIILSALPFIFIPGKWGKFSLAESRYLYIPVLGAAIFLAQIIFLVGSKIKIKKSFSRIIILLFVAPFLLTHILLIRNRVLPRDLKEAAVRKKIIYQIKNTYPALPQKSVFYVESDTAYYGLPKPTLPFQSGFGYTLMVIYRDYLDPRLFRNDLLFRELYAQGYSIEGGSGFGYFLDYDRLQKLINTPESRLGPESVYAFRWRGASEELIDITSLVRLKLKSKDEKNFIRDLLKNNLRRDGAADEEWVYFDDFYGSNPQQQYLKSPRKVDRFKDELFTAKPYTGWPGAMLVYNVRGRGSDVYTIPASIYGYKVVSIADVTLNNLEREPLVVQRKNPDGSWTLQLKNVYPDKDIIQFRLIVKVSQINLDKTGQVDGVLKTELLMATATGREQELKFKTKGEITAVANYSASSPLVYINGVATYPESIEKVKGDRGLSVRFSRPLSNADQVEVPVFVLYEPGQYRQ
ncbi:MAG: hypothetical protein ACOY3D_07245 [Candidatus Omnitrophota bacterium]